MVNRERQSWHCFGCGKGGDIFSFIQEIEGMNFVEALNLLAQKAGIAITHERNTAEVSGRGRIKDINIEAARFFHNFLIQMDAAKDARHYLKTRGLTDKTIEEWQIGFIPDQWDLLTKYVLKKGFGIDDLVASGLTIKREGADVASGRGFYDRFRGRIMFPIHDVHGAVVGFTGRVLVETEHSGGKYVNTPQTAVYDKSRIVFGLNKAKQEIRSVNRIVLVEGQMDVIACHQAGMKHVVATSGTAMTPHQVQLLKRYSTNICIAFDADAAGQAAAKRGIDIALEEGMSVRIISLPPGAGKDPDECVKKDPAVWFQAVEDAEDVMHWYVKKAFAGKDPQDPKQKQQIVNEILPEVSRIPFAVERDHWLREVSARLGVDVQVLREDMDRLKKAAGTLRTSGPADAVVSPPIVKKDAPAPRLDLLIERMLAVLFRFPELFSRMSLPAIHLSTPPIFALYEATQQEYTVNHSIDISHLRDVTSDNGEILIDILLMKGELDFSHLTSVEAKEEVHRIIPEIKLEWIKRRRRELQVAIQQAEREGDKSRLETLINEFQQLT